MYTHITDKSYSKNKIINRLTFDDTLHYIIIVLIASTFSIQHAFAQSHQKNNEAVNLTAQGIQIGEKVPDVLIKKIGNYKTSTAKLSDFEGKILILDFWATWCSPCVGMIPVMGKLQEKYNENIQFLSVSYEKSETVNKFLTKTAETTRQETLLPQVTEDKELRKLFPHRELPHYVWISAGGKVLAITGPDEITEENIEKIISSDSNFLQTKIDYRRTYDMNIPLLVDGNGGDGHNLFARSILTGYVPGLSGGFYPLKYNNEVIKLTVLNCSIPPIIAYAYSRSDKYIGTNRLILEVADSTKLIEPKNLVNSAKWQKENYYCYEIVYNRNAIPKNKEYMQQDLNRFFPQYEIEPVLKKVMCWVLERTSAKDKIKSKGGEYISEVSFNGCKLQNASLWEMFVRMNVYYFQNSPYPLENEADYDGPVDINLECSMTDMEEVNKALKAYDLQFVKRERVTDMIIVRDNPAYLTKLSAQR